MWDNSTETIIQNDNINFLEKLENWKVNSEMFWNLNKEKFPDLYSKYLFYQCIIINNDDL